VVDQELSPVGRARGRARALPGPAWVWLVAVGCLSALPFLGQVREVSSNEVRHAEIAREMAAGGDWLRPTLLGEEYRDKPPVFHGLVALSYRIAGHPSLTLARLVSVLSAILATLVWFALARRLASRGVAWTTSLALWGLPGFAWAARVSRPDTLFMLGILAACLCCARAWEGRGGGRGWFFAGGLALGVALVCKGPVSVLIVVLFLTLYPALDERFPRTRWSQWGWLVSGVLVSSGGWAAATALADGGRYLREVLLQPDLPWNPGKGVDPPQYLFYVGQSLARFVPLALFLPWVLREYTRGKRGRPALWLFLAGLLVLTVANKKRAHYLLPLLPFLTLFAIENLAVWRSRRGKRVLAVAIGLSILVTPIRYMVAKRGSRTPAEFAMARAFTGACGADEPLYCQGKLAILFAFVGRRGDVRMLPNDPRAVAARIAEVSEPGCLVAPEASVEALRDVPVAIERVTRSERYKPEAGWQLTRFRPTAAGGSR